MASPELAIAKATLSATLFRANPVSLDRSAVEAFFSLLDAAAIRCDPPNVQKCRQWIQQFVCPSEARTTALARYFGALSKSFQDEGVKPSLKRRRLHLLYVLNDVLHHAIGKMGDDKFGALWDSAVPTMVASAASFNDAPKHKKKLENLISIWEERKYLSTATISNLREALANGATTAPVIDFSSSASTIKLAKDTPYVLPSCHGDPSTPWYDLPAATWLSHLTPNSTKPMVPEFIKPLQLAAGPADPRLASAVKSLLSDVNRLYSKGPKTEDASYSIDLNELGQRIVTDDVDQVMIAEETYYGWSRQFCEKMRESRKKQSRGGNNRGRSASRSSRGSRSSSPPALKRRRLSNDSEDGSLPRRHFSRPSRSPSRSRSRTRSQSRGHDGHGHARRRSASSPRFRSDSDSRSRPYRSPPRGPHHAPPPPPPHAYPHHPPFPPIPPHGDFPIPPPPPPPPGGYQGPWPPPPPPPPIAGTWFTPNHGIPPPPMIGGWAHPPPPPPPPQHQGYGDYGRGGGYRGRGRGGYDRGRGW